MWPETKISYLMESMPSRGITGNIGSVLVGVRMSVVSVSTTKPFIIRNGVETALTEMVLAAGSRMSGIESPSRDGCRATPSKLA